MATAVSSSSMLRGIGAIIACVVAGASLTACAGTDHSANVARANASAIWGRVVIGPLCPVQRSDSPCPDRPVQASVVIATASGHVIRMVASASNGTFSVDVPRGRYRVTAVEIGSGGRASRPLWVTVAPQAPAAVEIRIDSGIR
jgi:hypothetical protein